MDALSGFVSTFLARIVGLAVAGVAGYALAHWGFNLDAASQQQLVQDFVGIVMTMLGAYAATHRTVSKFTNPGDAAGAHLAAKESSESTVLKANSP